MTLWTISNDMIPWNHTEHVKYCVHSARDGVDLLEVTPEWVYGASPGDELIYASNNYAARETLSCFSDGMGGSCADHILPSRAMLCVPLWRDDEAGPSGGYHPAAIVGLSLLSRMEDYLLLDEDDYSEREFVAWEEYITDEFNWIDDGDREDSTINSHRARFLDYAWEHLVGYYSVFDVPTEDIERAYNETKGNDDA